MTEETPRSLEDRLNQHDNPDEVAKHEREMLAPAGTYTTIPPLSFTPSIPEDGPNKGRFMLRFFGAAFIERAGTGSDGQPVVVKKEGRFGFGLSPDAKHKEDGQLDLSSKLYVNAKSAYRVAYGQESEGPRDVAEYLTKYPVRIRVIQVGIPTERNPEPTGEPGNMVVAISPVRDTA